MKTNVILFTAHVLIFWGIICNVSFGQGAYHKDTEFTLRAGFVQSSLRHDDVTTLDVGIDYTPWECDDIFSYSFSMNFEKSKSYWSINPIGATSIILSVFCKNIVDKDETTKKILAYSAFESMKLNFALGEQFEVGPNWSLLRLSKRKKGATYVTGQAGIHANLYFGKKKNWSLRARGEYSWGYGNADWWGERLFHWLNPDEEETHYEHYKTPHTPFKGWIYGISIGYNL